MGLRSFQDSFGAGDIKQYSCGGYFTIAASSDEVDIELFSQRGNSKGVIQNVAAGFWFEDEDITHVQVTSASAQTIEVISGAGKVGINKTTTSINGGELDFNTHDVDTYLNGAVDTTLVTIITPAANTGGIVVYGAHSVSNTAGHIGRFMYKTSAPSSATDGKTIHMSTTISPICNITMPFIIPAGNGLYLQGLHAQCGLYSINYKVL